MADSRERAGIISFDLSREEARWLITAINITLRLLEGLRFEKPETSTLQVRGLAALRRIARQCPSDLEGYYF